MQIIYRPNSNTSAQQADSCIVSAMVCRGRCSGIEKEKGGVERMQTKRRKV